MPTEKLDRWPDVAEQVGVAILPSPGQLTMDEVIASLRCIECDAPITGDRADCAALRCHDCD